MLRWGRWEEIRKLGAGGQGTAYLVRDTSAVETARDAFIHHGFGLVSCTRYLIHDWQCLYREFRRICGLTSGTFASI